MIGLVLVTGILVLVYTVKWPILGVILAIAIESSRLVFVLGGVDPGIATIAVGMLLMLSCVSALARTGTRALVLLTRAAFVAFSVVLFGIVIVLVTASAGLLAAFMNIFLVPVLAVVVAATAKRREQATMMTVLAVALLANFMTAVWQVTTGTSALLAEGYEYGTVLREIDGVLRTPGLTLTNSSAGLLAGAGALSLVLYCTVYRRSINPLLLIVALASGVGLLVLSTSRSGLILLGVGLAVFLMGPGTWSRTRPREAFFRILAALVAISLPVVFVVYGAGSSFSLFERFEVWRQLIDGRVSAFGLGAGKVGAASYSDMNPENPVFVDSSWLSILLQFGVFGLAVLLLWLVYASYYLLRQIRLTARYDIERVKLRAILAILWATSITGLFVEIIDYPIATLLLGLAAGSFMRVSKVIKSSKPVLYAENTKYRRKDKYAS